MYSGLESRQTGSGGGTVDISLRSGGGRRRRRRCGRTDGQLPACNWPAYPTFRGGSHGAGSQQQGRQPGQKRATDGRLCLPTIRPYGRAGRCGRTYMHRSQIYLYIYVDLSTTGVLDGRPYYILYDMFRNRKASNVCLES